MTLVTTVTGTKDSSELGITLPHEHLINDMTSWATPSTMPGIDADEFFNRPVAPELLWELRNDPFSNLDNCRLDNLALSLDELRYFSQFGGQTIIDATGLHSGRNLRAQRELSERSGVNVIAGTGYYLDSSLPESFSTFAAEDVAQHILTDIAEGEAGIKPGIIGEIGVSSAFTAQERVSLAGAFIAQRESGLPIEVHLPGWFRLGHEVLDIAESYSVPPHAVVLCHMNPSGYDHAYQADLLKRGTWLQYDMIGMEVFYADQGVQCPSDEDNARNLVALIEAGFTHQLLMSQDIFIKSLLRAYGGPGYGHILQYFVPRLRRHGVDQPTIDRLLINNPRAVFEGCAR